MTPAPLTPEHERILAELRARGGGSCREIAARLGRTDLDALRAQLEWLRRRRHLHQNAVLGVWWIPRY